MPLIEQSRRERKKESTRRRIFEAAIELFRTHGFEATTVDEITEKADVGRGTFFNYFPRKDSVLAYLSEERLLEVEETAAALLAATEPASAKLMRLYSSAASAYEDNRELSRFVFRELLVRSFQPGEDSAQRWQGLALAVIEQGRSSGELRTDFDPVRAEAVLSSIYYATVYQWLMCECEAPRSSSFPLDAELRARLTLALEGLAAKGGRA